MKAEKEFNVIIHSCYFGRVSTNMRSQDLSLENSKDQIIEFILSHKNEVFDPKEDLYEERVSGVPLVKGTKKDKGFDELMRACGIEITDNNNELSFKIVAKSKYQKIYCKSTSRIGRMPTNKKMSLLKILKLNGVEVYFYNIRRSTFEMDDDIELLMFSYVDNNFSKNMSFNSRNNRVFKAKTRQVMMNKPKYGFDIIKEGTRRKYIINEEEYKVLHSIQTILS